MSLKFLRVGSIIFLLALCTNLIAQKEGPFDYDVNNFAALDSAISKKKIILFTGSSSIVFWKDLATYYPEHNVLNRGFGGSQMTDLLYYFDKAILPYKPKMIFIYEGDNDLAFNKTPEQILSTADSILHLIRTKVSKKVPVAFISPKPSIARWELKDQYVAYNQKLKAWTTTKKNVKFIDVWTPMLDQQGVVQQDLFIEDGLHMNKKGYDIWGKVIGAYLK